MNEGLSETEKAQSIINMLSATIANIGDRHHEAKQHARAVALGSQHYLDLGTFPPNEIGRFALETLAWLDGLDELSNEEAGK